MSLAWQPLLTKFEALSTRERWMVLGAGLAVIYALFNALLLGPINDKKNTLKGEIAQSQAQAADISQQLLAFSQHPVLDPDAENRSKIARLKSIIGQQSAELSALSETLVSPQAMPELLKGLLQKNSKIQLVAMNTIAPENIIKQPTATQPATTQQPPIAKPSEPESPEGAFYKHGVEMTIAGNYLDLLNYVHALEHLPMQLSIGQATLQAKVYPTSELTLIVYTMSLEQAWLSI